MKTHDSMVRTNVELAYCEVQALRRRLLHEPAPHPEVTARSLVDTIRLLGSVSAKLRMVEARTRKTA